MIVTTYNGQKVNNPRHEEVPVSTIKASCAVRVVESSSGAMAMFGMVEVMPGVAHVWGTVSADAKGHGISLTKAMKVAMADMREEAKNHRIHRLQTYVNPDSPADVRWIEALGFQVESLMVKGRPDGGDFLVYTTWR